MSRLFRSAWNATSKSGMVRLVLCACLATVLAAAPVSAIPVCGDGLGDATGNPPESVFGCPSDCGGSVCPHDTCSSAREERARHAAEMETASRHLEELRDLTERLGQVVQQVRTVTPANLPSTTAAAPECRDASGNPVECPPRPWTEAVV